MKIPKKIKLFVYGTLKRGERLHSWMSVGSFDSLFISVIPVSGQCCTRTVFPGFWSSDWLISPGSSCSFRYWRLIPCQSLRISPILTIVHSLQSRCQEGIFCIDRSWNRIPQSESPVSAYTRSLTKLEILFFRITRITDNSKNRTYEHLLWFARHLD